MPDRLALLVFAPVLWLQGRYVRRVTPSLPEPIGARMGCNGPDQQPLRLLILGDSAAAGVGVDHQQQALSGQLVQQLATQHQVHWQLIATTGHTLQQTLAAVADLNDTTFDVIVISIGVNDVTGLTATTRWVQQYTQLLQTLQQRFHPQQILCSALPPMHVFPALPQPLRWIMGARAKRFNQQLAVRLTQHPTARYVISDFPMQADFMASDGFHPSALAYTRWADTLYRHLQTPAMMEKP